jgi:hypothetical protein
MQLCSGLFSDHILPRRYHALYCENMLFASPPPSTGALTLTNSLRLLFDGSWLGRRGRVSATLGGQGHLDGQFDYPAALALLPGGDLVVRESGNGGRFQVFTR